MKKNLSFEDDLDWHKLHDIQKLQKNNFTVNFCHKIQQMIKKKMNHGKMRSYQNSLETWLQIGAKSVKKFYNESNQFTKLKTSQILIKTLQYIDLIIYKDHKEPFQFQEGKRIFGCNWYEKMSGIRVIISFERLGDKIYFPFHRKQRKKGRFKPWANP